MQENNVQVYSQRFLDLSNLSFFNFGQMLRYYSIEEPPTLSMIQYMDGWYMKCQLKQSMKHTTEQWVVKAFDRSLASIGGYNFLVTSIVLFTIGGYQ